MSVNTGEKKVKMTKSEVYLHSPPHCGQPNHAACTRAHCMCKQCAYHHRIHLYCFLLVYTSNMCRCLLTPSTYHYQSPMKIKWKQPLPFRRAVSYHGMTARCSSERQWLLPFNMHQELYENVTSTLA